LLLNVLLSNLIAFLAPGMMPLVIGEAFIKVEMCCLQS
jgi:hypothetical protein